VGFLGRLDLGSKQLDIESQIIEIVLLIIFIMAMKKFGICNFNLLKLHPG
jgi:hypothetical protein